MVCGLFKNIFIVLAGAILLCAAVFIASNESSYAMSTEEFEVERNYYNEDEVIITKYKEVPGREVVVIPSTIKDENGKVYNVTSISGNAFWYCTWLSKVTIPEGVTEIGACAFNGCSSLKEITIPKSVKMIGHDAFGECSSLSKVTIPEGVTEIGACAFNGCSSLKEMTISDSVNSIGSYTFKNCESLEKITMPNNIESIKYGAFEGCSSLKTINIPEGVTEIESWCFDGCSSLKEVTIPKSVNKIEYGAFKGCSSLKTINIPEGVTEIESWCFDGCSSLKEVTIPKSVNKIGYAFSGCSSLSKVTIPEGVTEIESWCFSGCSLLKEVTIPKSVNKIEDGTFSYCSSLKEITIPKSVNKIGWSAFDGCSSLSKVTILGRPKVEVTSFRDCNALREVYTLYTPRDIGGIVNDKTLIKFIEKDAVLNAQVIKSVPKVSQSSIKDSFTVKSKELIIKWSSLKSAAYYAVGYRKAGTKKWLYTMVENDNKCKLSDINRNGMYEYKIAAYKLEQGKKVYGGWQKVNRRFIASTTAKMAGGKKRVTAKVKKYKGASGYQVIIATNKKMKDPKTVTSKGVNKTKIVIKKLKKGKKYYVQVKPYKNYKGKKYFGFPSKMYKVKTK